MAIAFDAQGWQYDMSVGPMLVEVAKSGAQTDGSKLAQALPRTFFDRNRVTRDAVASVLARAVGGRTVEEEVAMPATIVIGGNNYQLNMGAGASIVNSNVNLGEGSQISVTSGGDKQEVLLAVEAIVRAGLAGDWSDDAAKDLASLIAGRADLRYEDVQAVALEVARREQPTKERLKGFLARIAASGISGALATGLTAGLAEAMHLLPL
ncbi:MAG TPA: hypothetical protein VHC45_08065 [Gaiellaceae bacterium]|nr:hypothetical protein [Gaiellaceae bacterium]